VIVNLAAQAGVRYSMQNPLAYVNSNLLGFVNLMEACVRAASLRHFVFASSSSVYGANRKVPFSEHDSVDHPISLYAATKKSNELIAHSYSHLYGMPVTGLRFFTVYGPWVALIWVTSSLPMRLSAVSPLRFTTTAGCSGTSPISMTSWKRLCVCSNIRQNAAFCKKVLERFFSDARYKNLQLGEPSAVDLLKFIEIIEQAVGIEARKIFLPMQPGDVVSTYAQMDDLYEATGFRPKNSH